MYYKYKQPPLGWVSIKFHLSKKKLKFTIKKMTESK